MSNVLPLRPRSPFRLHVFSGKLGPYAKPADIDLYNQVYAFWRDYWTGVMNAIQSKLPPPEEFFRQDRVLALVDHGSPTPVVVAFVCANQYNLHTSVREHGYLRQYNQEFFSYLADARVRSVCSAQHFTVNNDYHVKVTQVSYASVILGLLQKVYGEWAAADTALVGVARTDNGSCGTALKFGWREVGTPISLHNVPVSQIAKVGPPLAHPEDYVNQLINQYWKERTHHESGYREEEDQQSGSFAA